MTTMADKRVAIKSGKLAIANAIEEKGISTEGASFGEQAGLIGQMTSSDGKQNGFLGIGTVVAFATSTLPCGFPACNGDGVLRKTCPLLSGVPGPGLMKGTGPRPAGRRQEAPDAFDCIHDAMPADHVYLPDPINKYGSGKYAFPLF